MSVNDYIELRVKLGTAKTLSGISNKLKEPTDSLRMAATTAMRGMEVVGMGETLEFETIEESMSISEDLSNSWEAVAEAAEDIAHAYEKYYNDAIEVHRIEPEKFDLSLVTEETEDARLDLTDETDSMLGMTTRLEKIFSELSSSKSKEVTTFVDQNTEVVHEIRKQTDTFNSLVDTLAQKEV